jgi:hypothetical protein
MLNPFALHLQRVLSAVKGLRPDSAKHLLYLIEKSRNQILLPLCVIRMTWCREFFFNLTEAVSPFASRAPYWLPPDEVGLTPGIAWGYVLELTCF